MPAWSAMLSFIPTGWYVVKRRDGQFPSGPLRLRQWSRCLTRREETGRGRVGAECVRRLDQAPSPELRCLRAIEFFGLADFSALGSIRGGERVKLRNQRCDQFQPS